MSKPIVKGLGVLVTCGILIMFVGCAVTSSGRRFYSGEPRQLGDVALIFTKSNCHLDSITPEGQPKMHLFGNDHVIGELTPSIYELELRYYHQGDYSTASSKAVSYPLQVEAGHFYYIYAEFPAPNTWRPAVIDIVRDEDYQKIAKLNDKGWLGDSDEDPKFIKDMVKKYLNGPRTPLEKIDFNGATREGSHGKEDIKYLWK